MKLKKSLLKIYYKNHLKINEETEGNKTLENRSSFRKLKRVCKDEKDRKILLEIFSFCNVVPTCDYQFPNSEQTTLLAVLAFPNVIVLGVLGEIRAPVTSMLLRKARIFCNTWAVHTVLLHSGHKRTDKARGSCLKFNGSERNESFLNNRDICSD